MGWTQRFQRLAQGGVRVRLSGQEHDLLRSLPPQLAPVIEGDADLEHLRGRLFPPAYDDPEREAEYRNLVGDDLVQQRTAALEAFASTLAQGRRRGRGWTVDLDAESAQAWLTAFNDTRLILAQVVGVNHEDDWYVEPDPSQPAELMLWHVSVLQEELLAALTGSLEGPEPPD